MYFIVTLLIHALDQPKFYQELPGKRCPSPNPMNSNDISSDSVNTAWKKDLQFSVRPQLSSFYSAYSLDRGEILQLCLRECLQTEPLFQHAWIEIFSFLTLVRWRNRSDVWFGLRNWKRDHWRRSLLYLGHHIEIKVDCIILCLALIAFLFILCTRSARIFLVLSGLYIAFTISL